MSKDLVKQYIAGTLPAQEATKFRERVKAYEKRRELARLNEVLRRGFPRLRQELAFHRLQGVLAQVGKTELQNRQLEAYLGA